MSEMIPNILYTKKIDTGESNVRLNTVQHEGDNLIIFLFSKASGTSVLRLL
jgi:hypothetical protein